MWMQLKTLIGLRILLLKRVWLRSAAGVVAGALAVFTMIILGVMAVGAGVACFFLGWKALPDLPPRALMFSGDVIVLVVLGAWLMGMLMELQRADLIDFQKMLYLPVSLRMVFALNFAVSLSSPTLVIYTLGAIGLTAGLIVGAGAGMASALFLAAAFYLMLAAWSYHLQGMLAALMENKRRRRLILTIIPIVFIIISQAPNLLAQTAINGSARGRHGPPRWFTLITSDAPANPGATDWARLAHGVIPLAWLPLGLASARAGNYGVVAGCFVGMAGIAGLGLASGYRATIRHYAGGKLRRRPKEKKKNHAPAPGSVPFTGKSIPFLENDTGALVLASWLTLVRHPRIRMQMLMPLLMPILFALPLALRNPSTENLSWVGDFAFAGAMLYTFLSFSMFMCNHFGADQEGFQALVLLPTPRHKYFLAKNLALFPLVGVPYLILVAVVMYFLRPGVTAVATTLAQFVQLYFSFCLLGNYLSVYFPYRFQRASGQAARAKPGAFIGGLITMFALPVLMIPSGLCTLANTLSSEFAAFRYAPVGLIASLIVLFLTIWAYRSTIESTGNLLLAREQSILATLLKDKE